MSKKILVINPNTTQAMTDALKEMLCSPLVCKTTPIFFTATSGPSSINNETDCHESCLSVLQLFSTSDHLEQYDAFLVACYSDHPLVQELKKMTLKPVVGIFESSISISLLLLSSTSSSPSSSDFHSGSSSPSQTQFGIISTGKVWEDLLTKGVQKYLGTQTQQSDRFAGVETTGLMATELHDAPPSEVRIRMKDATKRLISNGKVGAVCLGCAGMVGMDEMVREACVEELGEEKGRKIKIIDGVLAGYASLEALLSVGL